MSPEPIEAGAITAQHDQLGAELKSLATPLGEFFMELQGWMDEDTALVLVRDWFGYYMDTADD